MRRALIAVFAAAIAATAFSAVDLPVPYLQQPDNQTCLPTCLTMTLNFLGREQLTSETVFRLHKRTQYDRYNLPRILKDYGLYGEPTWYERGWTKETIKHQLDLGRPVILGCNQGRYGHFILGVGYTADDKLIINDPSKRAPGYALGGPQNAVDWDSVLWRGGCIVSAEPIDTTATAAAARLLTDTTPMRMKPGEVADVCFEILNTGSKPWPKEIYLAPMQTRSPFLDTAAPRQRESTFFVPGQWKSPSCVGQVMGETQSEESAPTLAPAGVPGDVRPGQAVRFSFKMKAPAVDKATTFREHFGLVDAKGNWLSPTWLAGKGEWRLPYIVVEPAKNLSLPAVETFAADKPVLPWETKFGAIAADPSTTGLPENLKPMRLLTPGNACDVAWVGDSNLKDYKAESWIYLDYRPELGTDGFERVGFFIRDNGQHAADTKSESEVGECIGMTYDSDDGYLRAADIKNGGVDDYRPAPRFTIKESGWHKFSITAKGDKVVFELDGKPFFEAREPELKSGSCGVYYKSGFKTPANTKGVRFGGFKVEQGG